MNIRFKQRIRRSLILIDQKLGLRTWLRSESVRVERPGAFLAGDRALEWAWVVSHFPSAEADILDIGASYSPISTIAAAMGHKVVSIDISLQPYEYNDVKVIKDNFLAHNFGNKKFNCIILCSTIEHFGLGGRYNSPDMPDGDLIGMRIVRKLLKQDGIVLLTIPVGLDDCISPWHRIYGKIRLPELFKGFNIEEESFYVKCDLKKWRKVDGNKALSYKGNAAIYALGLFVLSKEKPEM